MMERIFKCTSLSLLLVGFAILGADRSGEMFGVFSPGGLETPHTQWAKPYINGGLGVLVVSPWWAQREAAELWQRLDCEVFPMMMASTEKPVAEVGTYIGHNPPEQLKALADSSIGNGKWNVAIVARAAWDKLPGEWRLQLLLAVRDKGAGLILVGDEAQRGLEKFLDANAGGDEGKFFKYAIPFNDIPALARDSLAKPLVKIASFGKGRVVALNYPAEDWLGPRNNDSLHALTPCGHASESHAPELYRPHSPDYDYCMALVARAVLWAAHKEGSPRLTGVFLPQMAVEREKLQQDTTLFVPWHQGAAQQHSWLRGKAAVRFAIAGDCKPPVELQWRIRSPWDEVENSGTQRDFAKLELPVLPAGRYYLELWLKKDGKVCDWAVVPFTVEAEAPVPELKMAKDSFKRGEDITGQVFFSRPLPENARVRCELWDGHDRLLAVRDGKDGRFSFAGVTPCSQLCVVKAVVSGPQGDATSQRVEICTPRAGNADFQFQLWCTVVNEPVTAMYLKALRKLGADSVLLGQLWTVPDDIVNQALAASRCDLRIFPWYSAFCNLAETYNDKGEPVWNSEGECLLHHLPGPIVTLGERAKLSKPFLPQGVMLSEEDGLDFKGDGQMLLPRMPEELPGIREVGLWGHREAEPKLGDGVERLERGRPDPLQGGGEAQPVAALGRPPHAHDEAVDRFPPEDAWLRQGGRPRGRM